MSKLQVIREQILAARSELQDIEANGLSRAEVRNALTKGLRDIEHAGLSKISWHVRGLVDGDTHGALGMFRRGPGLTGIDIGPLLVALIGADAIAAKIEQFVGLVPEGLDAPERAARASKLQKALDQLERAEEAEVCRLEAAGEEVDRRADARPEIVLEVLPS